MDRLTLCLRIRRCCGAPALEFARRERTRRGAGASRTASWRFVVRGPDGADYGFRGEIHEVVPPERVVQTFEFEGMPGHVSVQTTEKYLGCKQRLKGAVNDQVGIEPAL